MKNKEQEKLNRLIEQLKKDEFKYVPREEKEIDWSRYDRAQINEINDMLLLIRDAVDEATLRLGIGELLKKGPGRPQNPPSQWFGILFCFLCFLVLWLVIFPFL